MPSVIPLDNFLGAAVIGLVLTTVIYGITCLQMYLYYEKYSGKDRWVIKTIVCAVWVLETFHVALISAFVYHYTVTNWGDLVALARTTWTLQLAIGVGTIITTIVQFFFAHRIYRLSSGNWVLTVIVVFLSLFQMGFGMAFMIHGFETQFWSTTGERVNKIITGTALGGDILCDLLISLSMCYYLHTSRTGFKGTNRMINLLTTYTIRTGLLTTICTVGCLISFLTITDTMVPLAIFYAMAVRLYSNSFLSILNAREGILNQSMPQGSDLMTMSRVSGSNSYPANGNASKGTIIFARPPTETKWNGENDISRIELGPEIYEARSKLPM